MAQNLTQSSFLIYIEDRNKLLSKIFWETFSGFGMTSAPVNTSNGRTKYKIPSMPEPKTITVSKAANPDEDYLVDQWLSTFCTEEPLINGATTSGAILMVVPLKPCAAMEPYSRTLKIFDVQPTDSTLWNADKMNMTDVSRVEIQLACSGYKLG